MIGDIQNGLNLSEAYRSSRSKTSILCGIGIAWSALQFEFKEVSLGGIGMVDLSGASIALLISLCILYSFTRCTVEYAMQPKNVRRWRLARFDFKFSLNLVRGSLLILATSGLNRSVSTVSYVVISVSLFLFASMVMEMIGVFTLTPFLIFIRKRQGRYSVASRVMDASVWSRIAILIFAIHILLALGLGSLFFSPIRTLWPIPPYPITIWAVTVTAILVLASFVLENRYLNRLFALVEEDKLSGVTTIYNEMGEVKLKFRNVEETLRVQGVQRPSDQGE